MLIRKTRLSSYLPLGSPSRSCASFYLSLLTNADTFSQTWPSIKNDIQVLVLHARVLNLTCGQMPQAENINEGGGKIKITTLAAVFPQLLLTCRCILAIFYLVMADFWLVNCSQICVAPQQPSPGQ